MELHKKSGTDELDFSSTSIITSYSFSLMQTRPLNQFNGNIILDSYV